MISGDAFVLGGEGERGRGGEGGEMGRVAMFIYSFHALPASALQLQLQL